jgi:protein-tyrosine phosphatase
VNTCLTRGNSIQILGYHTDEEGCLLEVAGLRRLQVKQVMSYIHEGISCGEGVVVHCRAGANRSATVAAAYMMIYHR